MPVVAGMCRVVAMRCCGASMCHFSFGKWVSVRIGSLALYLTPLTANPRIEITIRYAGKQFVKVQNIVWGVHSGNKSIYPHRDGGGQDS